MKTSELLKRAEEYLWDGVGVIPPKSKTAFLRNAVRFADPGTPAGRRARGAIADGILLNEVPAKVNAAIRTAKVEKNGA